MKVIEESAKCQHQERNIDPRGTLSTATAGSEVLAVLKTWNVPRYFVESLENQLGVA